MPWDDNLSGVHKRIAESSSSLISVLAGPGTGKTSYGLMRRVARLLEEGQDPSEILLISFTRTAAHDLKEKLQDLGAPGAQQVDAMTLHAFCLRLLQQDDVLAQTLRTPRILLDHEVDLMLRDLPRDWGTLWQRRRKLLEYVAGWDTGKSPHPGKATLPGDRAFESQVISWLRRHRAMLIGEVVPLAFNYLANDPLNEALTKYKHVLIDEYQDLNFIEQRLVDLISEEDSTSLFVIGDDDQSIYGFRHAKPEGILEFGKRPDVESFYIDECGRCPDQVIDMSNSLIKQTPGRDKADLKPRQHRDGYVAIVQWQTLDEEIENIAGAIAYDISAERFLPGDTLVLTNRQEIGARLKKRLLELGVPAQSFFSQEPLRNEAAQLALAKLRLLVSGDSVSWRVLLGAGGQDGRSTAYQRLMDEANKLNIPEAAVLDRIVRGIHTPARRFPALLGNYRAAKHSIDALSELDLDVLITTVLPEDVGEVAELRQIALDLLPQTDELSDLLDEMLGKLTLLEVPETPNFVRIMSFHKSKGLTAESVYLVGTLQGVIPFLPASGTPLEIDAAIQEQRRLMYVAITRAASQLVISYPRSMEMAIARSWGLTPQRMNGRNMAHMTPSIYIQELGASAPRRVSGRRWIESYPNRS